MYAASPPDANSLCADSNNLKVIAAECKLLARSYARSLILPSSIHAVYYRLVFNCFQYTDSESSQKLDSALEGLGMRLVASLEPRLSAPG